MRQQNIQFIRHCVKCSVARIVLIFRGDLTDVYFPRRFRNDGMSNEVICPRSFESALAHLLHPKRFFKTFPPVVKKFLVILAGLPGAVEDVISN